MKYFKHDLAAFNDDKIWELIEIQGMQGYGIWWWLLEQLYAVEDDGFQIHASETWFKKASKAMNLTDWRTLVRTLDTLSEVGLIDSQLWTEHYIYSPGIIKRADAYVAQKLAARERKRRQREREKALKEAELSQEVTCDNIDVTPSHKAVLTREDPDPDPDLDLDPRIEMSLSPKSDETKPRAPKNSKLKGAELYLSKSSPEHRERFESWWGWYKKQSNQLESSPGSKAAAAKVWASMEGGFDYEEFRKGCVAWSKQAKEKRQFGPHGSIFLKGKSGHEEPYWLAALDVLEPQQDSNFLATAPSVATQVISPELEAELRAKNPMELTDEEFALLNPGFKIYGKGAA